MREAMHLQLMAIIDGHTQGSSPLVSYQFTSRNGNHKEIAMYVMTSQEFKEFVKPLYVAASGVIVREYEEGDRTFLLVVVHIDFRMESK